MKVKKWLLGFMTFAAMAVLCVVCAGAETYGDFEYDVLDDGTVEITDYHRTTNDGSTINVEIPDKINGRIVTGIGDEAFKYCAILTSITIPDGVTSIGSNAFYFCTNLRSVTIPDNVTEIYEGAFFNCTSLKSVTIPAGVKTIGPEAFGYQLYNDEKKTVDGFSIKYVKNTYGHYYATKNDFSKETCLVTEELDNGTIAIKGYAGADKTFTVPSEINGKKVTEIGDSVFKYCLILTSVTIPGSVTSIGDFAFDWCTSLTSITIPNSVTEIGYSAFGWCSSLTSITIPNSVTSIGKWAFQNCTSLTSITIPESVTSIGSSAFSGCPKLRSITIPNSVTSIGAWTFYGCTSLTSITIPKNVTSIGKWAFADCISLTSITIPDSVKNIGEHAFGYNYNYDNGYKKIDNFKIFCYSGTAGEKYAKDNGFTYELLDKPTLSKVTGVKLGGRAADALRINWTKNASADGYIVEMYQGNKWARVGKITNNSITTFRKSGLKAGTVYNFRVRAYKMSGKTAVYSAYSTELAARTNPSVMTGAKLAGRAADALRINWSKNASADGYIVEMYQGNKWVRVAKITSNSTTTFRKAGLSASAVYKFRVRAYKMSGKTALYGNYSATVTARTNPSIVKGVKIGGKAKDALRVNWTKNASAQGYIVEMYKGGKWVRVAKITNNSTTTFRKAGLARNTTYKFRVKAYYMSGKTALYGNYGSVSGKTAAK